jgi:hypothetical protein
MTDDVDKRINELIDAAPELTDDQRNRISALLRTGSNSVASQTDSVLPAKQRTRRSA